jgi:trehalose 6-phosphate phosphatase
MSQIAASHHGGAWAVFLDVDGTILEIASTPQDVYVPASLKILLNELYMRLDGALALITGRSIADLDRLLSPLQCCAAGIHGCERRESSGCILHAGIDPRALDGARERLSQLVRRCPQLLLEDKGAALAVHFRRALHLQVIVRETLTGIVEEVGPQFMLQPGKCVLEIRPSRSTKGSAIDDFMRLPPFCGKVPVFIGDDFTDEEGFAYVNRRGGISIRVGSPAVTLAQYWLQDVTDATSFLRGIPPLTTSHLRLVSESSLAETGD